MFGGFRWLVHPARLAFAVGLGAVAAIVISYMAISERAPFADWDSEAILGLLLLDLVLVLLLAALLAWQFVRVIAGRRAHSAGAQLHRQLFIRFCFVAVIPLILLAFFWGVLVNRGIETWFGEPVQSALESAVRVSDAYVLAHKQTITFDARNLSEVLGRVPPAIRADRTRFIDIVRERGAYLGLHAVNIYDARGRPYLRAPLIQDIGLVDPNPLHFAQLEPGGVIIYTDDVADQVRALIRTQWPEGGFIFIARRINSDVLDYQRDTRAAVTSYQRLEADQFRLQVLFALVYTVVAIFVLLGAVWLGHTFANKIVRPIGSLIDASQRISEGDLAARVDVAGTNDEIEGLGRAFNRMTGQLQTQRNELVEANRQVDNRRRFTEAVLSGVSAGVIGLDAQGLITVVNRSAVRLLGVESGALLGKPLTQVLPSIGAMLAAARSGGRMRDELEIEREDGSSLRLVVQISTDSGRTSDGGLVITFDDVTELAAAQRMAAWADVARRIAHEIKNPLTPIQLSAERLRRKYKKEVQSDPEIFDQCTDTIIRHVGDIGRMVDEFSSFARMPEPVFQQTDLVDLVRKTIFLQKVAYPDVTFNLELCDRDLIVPCDGRLLSQVLVNIIKNSGEAIAQYGETHNLKAFGTIDISLRAESHNAVIQVADNGGGWPRALRSRVTEPYVTTRQKGTGLGLAIVRKIIADHGGTLHIADKLADGSIVDEASPGDEIVGAVVVFVLPLLEGASKVNEKTVQAEDGQSAADPATTVLSEADPNGG